MKSAVNKLCELLTADVNIPVFDHTFPDGFTSACIVVSEASFNEDSGEGEYHVNIYAPNKPRVLDEVTDNSYPDMEVLEAQADGILTICRDLWMPEFSGWAHKRQLFKEGSMHYLNICLTIQFN